MLYFHTNSPFSIECLTMLGLSSKDESQIGRYGTGLKYAVARQIKAGNLIRIWIDGQPCDFTRETFDFRGKQAERIILDGALGRTVLPFTTEYGKSWQDWQVFRELESNTRDEGGWTARERQPAQVVIETSGLDEFFEDGVTFLPAGLELLARTDRLEIYEGESSYIYGKGVRIEAEATSRAFTYNWLRPELTEDRTIRSFWDLKMVVGDALSEIPDEEFFRWALNEEDRQITYDAIWLTTPARQRWTKEHGYSIELRNRAADRLRANTTPTPATLTAADQRILNRAARLANEVLPVDVSQIVVTEDLPSTILGMCRDGVAYVALSQVREGATACAATIIEEVAHRDLGLADETRKFQDWLIRRLAGLAERTVE
jgi:hypothetical protein